MRSKIWYVCLQHQQLPACNAKLDRAAMQRDNLRPKFLSKFILNTVLHAVLQTSRRTSIICFRWTSMREGDMLFQSSWVTLCQSLKNKLEIKSENRICLQSETFNLAIFLPFLILKAGINFQRFMWLSGLRQNFGTCFYRKSKSWRYCLQGSKRFLAAHKQMFFMKLVPTKCYG